MNLAIPHPGPWKLEWTDYPYDEIQVDTWVNEQNGFTVELGVGDIELIGVGNWIHIWTVSEAHENGDLPDAVFTESDNPEQYRAWLAAVEGR